MSGHTPRVDDGGWAGARELPSGFDARVSPKAFNERWAPPTDSAELTAVESAKLDPQAAQNANAVRNPNVLRDLNTLEQKPASETEIPAAATLPTASVPTIPVSTEPVLTRAKRRSLKGSGPGRKSEARSSRAVDPTPPPASAQSQIRVPPEEYKWSLWLESPKEREARKKAEAQKQPPSEAPPSSSTQPAFNPEELIFK